MQGFDLLPSTSRSRTLAVVAPSLATLSLLLVPSSARAGVPPPAVVQGNIVLQQGDTPTGGAGVVDMAPPFVNASGEVGFVGLLDDGDHYLFIGNSVVWQGTDDGVLLLDALEPRMDSSGMGGWVYPMDADGADGLYTDAGLFAVAGDPIPMLMGSSYTFLGNPTMNADGSIYFVVGIDDNGDGAPERYGLLFTPDGSPGAAELVYAGGDMVDMETLLPDGIDFDYSASEDGMHLATILYVAGNGATNGFVRVDDMFVARELDPTGDGDNWDNFDLIAINNAGNYLFTGDTDGPGGADEFIAFNSTIVVREGDTIGGVNLSPGSALRFAAISDLDQAAFAWATNAPQGFREVVFFACDANDIPGSTQEVFTTIDTQLDVDGDDVGDFTIVDLTIGDATVGKAIGETQFLYAEVALDDGMGSVTNAMIEVPVSCCGNGAVNPFEDCDDGNDDDTDECVAGCVAASCGDGFVQDGVEDCDDGNDDDTDACVAGCVAASCGDGFVQDGVEDCDDGNDDDTDACPNDCALAGGVDETGGGTGDGTSGTGGGSGPGPVTLSGGFDGSSGGDTDTDTDTDGDSAGGVVPDDGCNCSTGQPPRWSGAAWSLLGLGLLGLGRRRRTR